MAERPTVLSAWEVVSDLHRLGVRRGDHLMVHASLRAIGPVAGGAEAVVGALDAAVGPDGTLLMVLGARDVPEWSETPPAGGVSQALREGPPFDPLTTPAHPEIGWLSEVFRRVPGTRVTDHPLGRFGARGRLARTLLDDPPWHDYYGPNSALDRLCRAGGRVLRLGADLNTVTLLHWAEYLAPLPEKRRVRRYVLTSNGEGPRIRYVDSLDDSEGIVHREGEDYFTSLIRDYLDAGHGLRGNVGNASSELLEANHLTSFAVEWLRDNLAGSS